MKQNIELKLRQKLVAAASALVLILSIVLALGAFSPKEALAAATFDYDSCDKNGWNRNYGQFTLDSGKTTSNPIGPVGAAISTYDDGYSLFTVASGLHNVNMFPLDVTRPVFVSFAASKDDDKLDIGLNSGEVDDLLASGGIYTSMIGWRQAHHDGTDITFNYFEVWGPSPTEYASFTGLPWQVGFNQGVGYKRVDSATAPSDTGELEAAMRNKLNLLKYDIATDGYTLKYNTQTRNKSSNINQSSFNGAAYFAIGALSDSTAQYLVKLYQEFDIEVQMPEVGASVNFTAGTVPAGEKTSASDESAYFANTVEFTLENVPENKIAKVSVKANRNVNNHATPIAAEFEQIQPDEEGNYSFRQDWGKTEIKVEFVDKFTVAFMDGNALYAQYTVIDGERSTKPADPTRPGYSFVNWFEKVGTEFAADPFVFTTGITRNYTLYAKWAPLQYGITYVLFDKGVNDELNPAVYTLDSSDITFRDATPSAGYTFDGWYEDVAFSAAKKITGIESGDRSGALTVYAKFNAIEYTVTYELDGGTNHAENPAKFTVEDTDITLKPGSKDGYIFEGWYKDAGFTEQVTKISKGSLGELKLYAKFSENVSGGTGQGCGGCNSAASLLSIFTLLGAALITKKQCL